MKLGPWFNGKHNALSLDRSTDSSNKKAFPTSVYLDKLEGSGGGGGQQTEHPQTSSTHSDDIFDDISPAASNVSNNVPSPENITEHHPKKVYNKGGGHRKHRKHHRHHHYHTAAATKANVEEGGGTPLPTSSLQVGEGEGGGVYSTSSNHGSFRFLNAEEISDTSSSVNRKQAKFSAKERQKAKEHQKIQWSDNEDRLI